MTFEPRHPFAAPGSPDRIPHAESFASVKLPAGVLAKVGESFAVALSALQRLLATLEPLAPGQQSVPTIRVERRQPPSASVDDDDLNEIHWLLFVQLARAMGLVPQRTVIAQTLTLTLCFPVTGAPAAGDGEVSAALLPRTASAAGHRVLLIEPHEITRVHAHQLMRGVGMRVDAVTNIERAHACLRDGVPNVVVTGIPVSDRECEALLNEIRAAQPRLRVIDLVDDNDAFAISVPGSDSPARVGRYAMARTLMSAMSQELDAAWPT